MINYQELSKEISNALRHEPKKYGLIIDNNGWANVDDSMYSLKRNEIFDNKIRALCGHSISIKIGKESSKPPKYLYHAPVRKFVESIKKKGLISKGRQYVYLSSDIITAMEVAKRA